MLRKPPLHFILIVLSISTTPGRSFERMYFGADTRDYCLHESFNASCKQPAIQQDGSILQHAHFSSNHLRKLNLNSNHNSNNGKNLNKKSTNPSHDIDVQVRRVVMLNNAVYGRMRPGRCITGSFNTGCSMSATYYVDSHCSGKQFCDMSVRHLVDIHPCQRDFMSYLEASYSCIDVHVTKDKCPPSKTLSLKASPSGKILHESSMTSPHIHVTNLDHITNPDHMTNPEHIPGSEECPWRIIALSGERIKLKIMVIGDENILPSKKEDFMRCSDIIIIKEPENRRVQLNACDGMSRERTLHTSNSSEITLHVFNSRDDDVSDDLAASDQSKESSQDGETMADGRRGRPTLKFIISYEATGCKNNVIKNGEWMRKSQDNVMVKCNHSLVTWYLTCQGNKWVGLVGNCTGPASKAQQPDSELRFSSSPMFPTLGILLAVLLGIGLGIIIGMVLLLFVHCLRKKAICNGNKQGYPGLVRRKGSTPDPNYHHPFQHEPPHMYGCVSLIDNPNNEPYHPLRSSSLPPEAGAHVVFPPASNASNESESGKLLKNSAFSTTPLSMQHYNSAADNRSLRKYNSQPRQHHHQHQQQLQLQQQQYSLLQYDECCPTCIAHDLNNEHNINRMNNLMVQQTQQQQQQQQQQNNDLNESILYPIGLRNPEGHFTLNKTPNNANNNNNSSNNNNNNNSSNNNNNNSSNNNNNNNSSNNYNENNESNNNFRDDKICVV